MKVAVFGLGKLGLPMAALFTTSGYQVVGVDTNASLVSQLQTGKCFSDEPGLEDLLKRATDLKVTTDYLDTKGSTLFFVMVPTPSRSDWKFDDSLVMSVVDKITQIMSSECEHGYPVIVVTSTVMPGTMDKIHARITQTTQNIAGVSYGLVYNPEFIALGNVIRNMQNPDAILIGESDNIAGTLLENFYRKVCVNHPKIHRMSFWNAEIAKIALNTFVTTKISLANTIAQICESVPEGNVDKVTAFLGDDTRIGAKYFRGGLGFMGPCFPRDQRAFIEAGKVYNITCPIQKAVDSFNDKHVEYVASRIKSLLPYTPARIAILGATYKTDTPVIEESHSLRIAEELVRLGHQVRLYDPVGMNNVINSHPCYPMTLAGDTIECITGADICVLATQWLEFDKINPSTFVQVMRHPIVYDCWRFWNQEIFRKAGVKYFALGVNN